LLVIHDSDIIDAATTARHSLSKSLGDDVALSEAALGWSDAELDTLARALHCTPFVRKTTATTRSASSSGVESRDLRTICSFAEYVSLPHGAALWSEGDEASDMFIVLQGRVEVLHSSAGKQAGADAQVHSCFAGDFLGETEGLVHGDLYRQV
jgi:hypothetical protein